MRKLLIRPQAHLDLLEIWHYIARTDVGAANRIGERLEAAIEDLCAMPGQGHTRADVKSPLYGSGASSRTWSLIGTMTRH